MSSIPVQQMSPLLVYSGKNVHLFKSPRCAHDLCAEAGQTMQQHKGRASAFLAAMHDTVSSPIFSAEDFTNPKGIIEAAALLDPPPN